MRTHGSHTKSTKKSADFIRRRKVPWRFFVQEIALPHIDPLGSRHLAVSNGRLPDPVSRITPDANIILREVSRNLHVFFPICHAEKSERGTLASVTLIGYCGPRITHQERKKSANLHQAAESSVEIFAFGRSLSRTSTLLGQGTLPSPMAGCRIRFPEPLLMLKTAYKLAGAICQSSSQNPQWQQHHALRWIYSFLGGKASGFVQEFDPDSIITERYILNLAHDRL